ncbi:MAG TPA: acyltransferase family protein [Symbiobacteriaceae bacterium]|nr:acyltransferase family protein [Symbiobacteriaceae bacterium]
MTAAATTPSPVAKSRLFYLDTLKVALTMLVVLHHVGQAYGPTGGFWYVDDPVSFRPLGPFFRVNASFFMGLFFFLSAYFLPATIDRKGAGPFLKDRLMRLGVPIVLFLLTLIPLMTWASFNHFRGGNLPFGEYCTQVWLGLGTKPPGWTGPAWPELNFGHLWFIEHLLVYAAVYAAWRAFYRNPGAGARRLIAPPGDLALLGYAVAMAAVTYVVRIPYPIDKWVGILGFIQAEPAHLPQYASLFVLGVAAYRNDWLQRFDTKVGYRWLALGAGLVVLHFSLTLTGHWYGVMPRFLDLLWECLVCVSLSAGLITLFREKLNGDLPVGKWLAANAYGAYLFHIPVLVLLQYAVLPLQAGGLVKFLLVSAAAVPFSFLVTDALRRIPGATRVL